MALVVTPNSGQNLNQTLIPIQSNFSTINSAWSVNHVEYGVTGQGKHNLVTFPVQAADPATAASEMALYTKLVSSVPQLFLRQQSNGTVVNFTSYTTTGGVDTSTTLPSGLIVKFGTATTNGSGLKTVTFTAPFTTILACWATVADTSGSNASANDNVARIYNYGNASLSVVTYFENTARTRVSDTFSWLAIGI